MGKKQAQIVAVDQFLSDGEKPADTPAFGRVLPVDGTQPAKPGIEKDGGYVLT